MNATTEADVLRWFEASLDQPVERRDAWLREQSLPDALRERVQRLLRVEAVTTCALSVATADGRAVVTPDEAAMRAAAERPPREITTQAFRLDASDGARYVLTLRPPPGAPACRFSVRYREAAP